MFNKITGVLLAFTALHFTGCESMQQNHQATEQRLLLENRTWVVTYLQNTEVKPLPNQVNVASLQFDSTSQHVSGSDSCNRIMGTYTVQKDQINISALSTTRMACVNDQKTAEKFHAVLPQVTHYQVYGKNLKLTDRHGNALIQLESTVQSR